MTQQDREPVRFGTDGIRGPAGEAPLDEDTLRRIGAAVGIWLATHGRSNKRVVIGNDGRASADWILSALGDGLAGTDATVTDLGLVTTPALAFVTRETHADAGIMISASHNPASDNGVKLFASSGSKLPDDDERAIEELIVTVDPDPEVRGRFRRERELVDRYEEHLANTFEALELDGMKIVVDGANGGGSRLGPAVLRGFGAEVVEIACEPDGANINDGVGALHPGAAARAVVEHGAAFGICLDGDGDRGIFVDAAGNVRNGDDCLLTLGALLHEQGRLSHDTIVATVMSNLGMYRALEARGVAVETTPVGDRNVTERMRDGGFALGGEQSGHIIFDGPGHLTGDGLFTALSLLAAAGQREGRLPFVDWEVFPQRLVNVRVESKPPLDDVDEITAAVRAVEADLGRDGRVLLRYSGTEPLCRVMVEGRDAAAVDAHVATLTRAVESALCR